MAKKYYYPRDKAQHDADCAEFYAKLEAQQPKRTRVRILLRWGSLWIGAHWSGRNRRWCLNPLPCVTVCIVLPGGVMP